MLTHGDAPDPITKTVAKGLPEVYANSKPSKIQLVDRLVKAGCIHPSRAELLRLPREELEGMVRDYGC